MIGVAQLIGGLKVVVSGPMMVRAMPVGVVIAANALKQLNLIEVLITRGRLS